MNELKSYTEYAVSTPTADFVIGFDFNYGEDAVNVTVDDVPATTAGYTVVYLNETTIRLSPSVPSGVVRLQRETDIDQTDHAYRAGAKFIAQTMDENFEQLRHAQQEVRDGFNKLSTDTHEIIEGLDAALELAQDAAQNAQDAAVIAQGAADTVNTIIVGGKVDVDNVLDASGETQQQVNYNGGSKWHSRVGGYKLNERVILTNGDIVKSTVNANTNNPNVNMTGWEITDNGFVLVDSRKLGLVGGLSSDQSVAVTACNNYVNSIPVNKDTPIVLRLPKGLVKSSVGFAFDRQTILYAQDDSLFEYTGSEYAVRLGKLGVTDYTDGFRTFGIKGVSLTGADNCTHGIYVSQYVLAPTLEAVKFLNFGNQNNANSYCIFFQGHNWDIYIRNCKLDNISKNYVNLIRVNGVLVDGTLDYGNSRLNLIDSFFNQGGNDCAGVGVFLNSFKSRIIGGGFQGYKNCIQLGEYGQTPEINGTYFESIYQNCESIFKIGEDGYTSEKVFSDISLLNIYANLHNINNEYGNTNVKFLTTAQNVKLNNLKIDNIKTLNGDKYPLLSLQNLSGQTCDLGNVSHNNALLHNIRDDQMVVANPKENHFPNSDLKVWQRGSTFSFVSGEKKLADGFRLIGDGSTGNINIYNEAVLSEYNFPSDAVGMMRIVRTSVSTDASYCTIRARIGELSVLSGNAANLSFVAKSDKDMSINVTLVRNYGSNIEYISAGSVAIKSGSTAKTYAKSFNIPMLNRSYVKTTAARTYVDITLPTNLLFVLDISCFSLQQGSVKSGWESNNYAKDFDLASEFYQVGGYNVVTSGQLKIQIPLRRMRYTPTITSHVAYQDAVVDYNATTPIVEQSRFVTLLNAVANDVSINWTADAEL